MCAYISLMARPKKGREIGATAGVACRITPELRAELDAIAERHGRTITQELRAALEEYVANYRRDGRRNTGERSNGTG